MKKDYYETNTGVGHVFNKEILKKQIDEIRDVCLNKVKKELTSYEIKEILFISEKKYGEEFSIKIRSLIEQGKMEEVVLVSKILLP